MCEFHVGILRPRNLKSGFRVESSGFAQAGEYDPESPVLGQVGAGFQNGVFIKVNPKPYPKHILNQKS